MLHNAMLAALGVAAAGTADAKRLVGHCSAPANDRSQTTQLFPVRKNLIILPRLQSVEPCHRKRKSAV